MSKNLVKTKSMFLYDNRLNTFKDWPFLEKNGAKCTEDRLAYSGFYRPNPESEPDLTRCFMCYKELEGWEITDDPEIEHANHSKNCPFLSIKIRDTKKMTTKEFIKFMYTIQIQEMQHLAVVEKKKLMEKVEENFKKEKSKLQ